MDVLVVGAGGREHAIAWKVAQSNLVEHVYIAPGNPGTAEVGYNVAIAADDIAGLRDFALEKKIELTIVGPEIPLVMGIVDEFAKVGLRCWGPSKSAAELEGSKVAMKEFLRRHNIPTAPFKIFSNAADAHAYLEETTAPIVIKCDGLAAGKGVTVAKDMDEAHDAVERIMVQQVFGAEAGKQIIIEDILRGEEISIFALCDGYNAVLLEPAQDHKQAYDGDQGPNTGGMGAFSPAPGLLSEAAEDEMIRRILVPTMSGLVKEGRPYVGVLYLGLMLTDAGPKVIEYNVRFGDPECQVLLPRLKNDLVKLCLACLDQKLNQLSVQWLRGSCLTVTMAAPGYPGDYPKGLPITGTDELAPEILLFHAGTKSDKGQLLSNGGRVLNVTTLAETPELARQRVYAACDQIAFDGKHYRRDIGTRQEARSC